jgi:hypothetical protein
VRLSLSVPSEFGIEEVWALTVPSEIPMRMHCNCTAEEGFLRLRFLYALSTTPSSPAPRVKR